MSLFRLVQLSIAVLLVVGSTWLVRALDAPHGGDAAARGWLASDAALAGVLRQGDNGDNGDNRTSDNGDNGGADNGDDNGNSNRNTNSNNNNNDNDSDDIFIPPPPPASSGRPPEPTCSTPGQETVFTSHDGKLAVRVFPTTPQPVRIEVYQVIDFLSAPLPPGNIVGLLAYEIRASYCDSNPLQMLPAEVNLAIRYNDIEAIGLDESRFVVGWLDLPAGTWIPEAKQANDPASNVVTATIIRTGFYMVWEAR